jgi:hypothetical protein
MVARQEQRALSLFESVALRINDSDDENDDDDGELG